MALTTHPATRLAGWLAIVVFAVGCQAAPHATTPRAMSRATATGEHGCTSVHTCQWACNQGEGAACTSLAARYEANQTPANFSRARAAYGKACDLDSGAGCVGAAAYEIDDLASAKLLRRACTLGVRRGCAGLSRLAGNQARACQPDQASGCDANVHTIAARRTPESANIPTVDRRNRLSRACTAGVFTACQVRGRLVAAGTLRVRSAKQKIEFLELACVAQEPTACKMLGGLYLAGMEVRRNPGRARTAFDRACRHGDPGTCRSMGAFIMNGETATTPDDAAIAAHLYERGCDQGHEAACLDFGRQLQLGNGVARDRKRAARVFETACNRGGTRACTLAADLYRKGWGVAFAPNKAATLYDRACKSSEAGACRKLSQMYRAGSGVTRDPARANVLLQRACMVGSPTACDEVRQAKPQVVAQ